jgi:hypothetical protein
MTGNERHRRLVSLLGLYSGSNTSIEAKTECLDSGFLWFYTETSCKFRDKQSNYAHTASFQLPFSFITHLLTEYFTLSELLTSMPTCV